MSEHASHEMHENSRKSYEELLVSISERYAMILGAYRIAGYPLTDRQVLTRCGFRDMNKVRPRITELVKRGDLVECGKALDAETNRKVRLVRPRPMQAKLF